MTSSAVGLSTQSRLALSFTLNWSVNSLPEPGSISPDNPVITNVPWAVAPLS